MSRTEASATGVATGFSHAVTLTAATAARAAPHLRIRHLCFSARRAPVPVPFMLMPLRIS